MEQTKPLQRASVSGQSTQPVTAQGQPAATSLNMPKQPMAVQTQPAEKQIQPVSEKKSKWWLWLIIALAAVIVGIAVYLWVIPLLSS